MFKETKRGDRKILADFTLKDAYKKYKDVAIKELQVDFKTYKKVCKEFNKEIFTDIIEDNLPFKMPCRLGVLRVKKSKMNYKDKNKLKVDWKTSKEANKIVYHLNDHTNGYKFRFWWEKRGPIKNLSVYSFTPIREYKRLLSSILKDKNRTIDYFM